jgi:hypothetical protein
MPINLCTTHCQCQQATSYSDNCKGQSVSPYITQQVQKYSYEVFKTDTHDPSNMNSHYIRIITTREALHEP